MISSKKLINLARKWKNSNMISRNRITFSSIVSESCETCTVNKGHFVVYAADQRRFVFPLDYLNHEIFKELLELAEEEFGHPSKGAIRVPCDSVCMEYVVSLIRRGVSKDLEKALLMTITSVRCFSTSNLLEGPNQHQLPICGF